MSSSPIEFYFDFSSPYGYFASARIEEVAMRHGRGVNWHPILLGAIFRLTNQQPLAGIPLKGSYSLHDWHRCARLFGLPFQLPEPFPVAAAAPARLCYWAGQQKPGQCAALARSLYRAYFGHNRNISEASVCADIAADLGIPTATALDAMDDPAWRERLRSSIDAAVERGVFGSPYFIVDGEPFWGADRLDQLDRWLAYGGW